MPTIDKCENCGRRGGYAKDADTKVCARCAGPAEDATPTDDDQN